MIFKYSELQKGAKHADRFRSWLQHNLASSMWQGVRYILPINKTFIFTIQF